MGVHVHKGIEMVETVLEVADVAWNAMELRHRYQHKKKKDDTNEGYRNGLTAEEEDEKDEEEEVDSLRMENCRLRNILEENLKLLQRLSESPLSDDFPPDLHKRLEKAVDSAAFLAQLQSLHQTSLDETFNHFPFRKATGTDLTTVETLVNVGLKEPSLWVWVTHEETSPNVEELSEIDNEAYVVVNEELVVDGVANFMARCILSNPKSKLLTPEELQKTVSKALGGVNKLEKMIKIWQVGKFFFALSTWGLTLAGLYRHRAIAIPIVKGTARGVVTTSNLIMKAL